MLYALKLGPIETEEGRCYASLGVRDDGWVTASAISRRDPDGLGEVAATAGQGEPLRCEQRLARAGARLGFTAAEMPEWVLQPRAALAAMMALGRRAPEA